MGHLLNISKLIILMSIIRYVDVMWDLGSYRLGPIHILQVADLFAM